MSQPLRLVDFFRFFRGVPHQLAAVSELEGELLKSAPQLLNRNAAWYATWQQAGKASDNTWDGVTQAAKAAGAKFPELVAAQWALESAWGKHTAARHNYFGLKGSGSTASTQEFVNGQWITIDASFIDFPDLDTCVSYLVERWYKDFKYYRGCNNASTRDDAAKWLVRERYATDPAYAEKLITLMNEHAPKAAQPSPIKPATFTPKSPFTTNVTAHITYGELTQQSEARRFQHQYQCDTALELCKFLEKVRAEFGGRPLVITSGYRPPAINAQVGGASNSEHLYNAPYVGAVDFYIDGVDVRKVQDYCDHQWPCSVGYGAPRGFVHLGIRAGRPRVRWNY